MRYLCKRLLQFFGIEIVDHQRIVELEKQTKDIMTSLQSLQNSVSALSASVEAVVVKLNTPHVSDADLQLVTNEVNGQVAKLNAALGLPPVGDPQQPEAPLP
jgi:ABC-type Fe2+-enterobactin transport system substrate-binding protein